MGKNEILLYFIAFSYGLSRQRIIVWGAMAAFLTKSLSFIFHDFYNFKEY